MKILNKYFAFLMIALGLSVQCFAAQQSLKMTFDKSQTCDNYYIQPGGVYVAPNGRIFVLFDGGLIQVKTLCSDERGAFVPGIEMSRELVWCPICQHWYNPDKPHSCK